MALSRSLTRVFLLAGFWTALTSGCPLQDCTCQTPRTRSVLNFCQVPVINCRRRSLSSLQLLKPGGVSDGFHCLDARDNQITRLEDDSLPSDLQQLSLANNPLSHVSTHAFLRSANSLRRLDLSRTSLTALPKACSDLTNLQTLILTQTPAWTWDEVTVRQLAPSLTELLMFDTRVTSWPSWMKELSNLRELDFQENPIFHIPDSGASEAQLDNLEKLTLRRCQFNFVPDILSSFRALEKLDLSYNHVRDLHSMNKHENASSLALTLRSLNLRANMFRHLPDLSAFRSLTYLHLGENFISSANKDYLPQGLQTLFLNSNSFTAVPGVIASLTRLRFLTLKGNDIVQVRSDSFPEESQLQTLYLNNNPLISIDDDAFRGLSRLQYLNLASTELSKIPGALASLPSVGYLNMKYVYGMRCSQSEDLLTSWYARRQSKLRIYGKCSGLPLDFFLRSTSP